jgi:hypothetical protein
MPGIRRSARKARRPILPVWICVRVMLLCFRRPLYLLRAYGPKSAVVSAGSGRDRGYLALATATFRLCLIFQSCMTASSVITSTMSSAITRPSISILLTYW